MAIYAIGDIQGCYDPFRRLLDELEFDTGKDTLWLTGDIVNRGPKSLKTLRFVRSLGDSAITVLGNHDLHLLALSVGKIRYGQRFETLDSILKASDCDELMDWLRHRPLAHYDKSLGTLLVHAGVHPRWSAKKTLARAQWSGDLTGYRRLRFIVNCLTRMRMITKKMRLNFAHSGSPWRARKDLVPWYDVEDPAWAGTRVVFGHWSSLGLVVLPEMISLDTGCVWGRQLTAVRLDKRLPRVIQVHGQE
jgi:bis(5'-nucleosyl)-tetraphosphatase (symmetrical)